MVKLKEVDSGSCSGFAPERTLKIINPVESCKDALESIPLEDWGKETPIQPSAIQESKRRKNNLFISDYCFD